MKGDIVVRNGSKWSNQSSNIKSAPKRVLAVKMNNFFDEKSENNTGTWPLKESKKQKERPSTATLAKPRLLDIALLGKIDMSLMRKELLSVYRLIRTPIANVSNERFSLLKKSKDCNNKKSHKKDVVIDVSNIKDTENSVIALKRDIKDKSPFKLFPSMKQRNKKIDNVFNNPPSRPLAKPCDSCGRASRPERFHAHPHKSTPSLKIVDPLDNRDVNHNRKQSVEIPIATLTPKSSAIEILTPIHQKHLKKEGKQSPIKYGDAPPICLYCSRRFGTSSLPIHEAKCRERKERKSPNTKSTNEDTLAVQDPHDLRKSPLRSIHRENHSTVVEDRRASPRKIDLHVEKREDTLQVPSPAHRSRLSPNKERVPAITSSRYHQSESELEDSTFKEENEPESDLEWTSHLRSLIKCNMCNRAFAPDRVLRHQNICDGSSKRMPSINKTRSRPA